MNKIDLAISTNICTFFLLLTSAFFFFLSYNQNIDLLCYSFGVISLITFIFTLKVLLKRHQRVRVFKILTKRLQRKGYHKEVFKGKCNTICALSMNSYIILRTGHFKDLGYILCEHRLGTQSAIHEDETIEKAINQYTSQALDQ